MPYDILTIKYAGATGAILWEKRYNGTANGSDLGLNVAVDRSNNVLIAGRSYNEAGNIEGYVAKYAATDGTLLWDKRHTGATNGASQIFALALDSGDNVVVAGSIHNGSNEDFYAAKYAAVNGALIWEKQHNGPADSQDAATAMAVDGDGNVVVTGHFSNATDTDFYTAKYSAVSGSLLWERRYDGPPGSIPSPQGPVTTPSNDDAYDIAVDGSGNVIITGSTRIGNLFDSDFYTAKYAAEDGAILWEQRYGAPAKHYDFPRALAVDGAGNVIVTGVSRNSANNDSEDADDFYTAKYAAANGALLWERRYNGPANNSDEVKAMALDRDGNPVVTGVTRASIFGVEQDFYTAKYSSLDGALLWEKIHNGPANLSDVATGVVVGANGIVVVVGTTDRGMVFESATNNFTTVVYWESLPPVSVTLVSAGVRLRFSGVPDHSYDIERATAATGPWSTIATPTAPLDGLVEYIDTDPPTGGAFYRTSAQ